MFNLCLYLSLLKVSRFVSATATEAGPRCRFSIIAESKRPRPFPIPFYESRARSLAAQRWPVAESSSCLSNRDLFIESEQSKATNSIDGKSERTTQREKEEKKERRKKKKEGEEARHLSRATFRHSLPTLKTIQSMSPIL